METIQVRLFAMLRERMGGPSTSVVWTEGMTAGQVLQALCTNHPGEASLIERCRIAVNHEFVSPEQTVGPLDEIALIPPVSGGALARVEDTAGECDLIALVDAPIDVAALSSRLGHPECGAQALFVGVVREHFEGHPVRSTLYEAYQDMVEPVLRGIRDEMRERYDLRRVILVHRVGELPVGEISVLVAAASPHRQDAFAACRHGIERIKQDAPIWKKENYTDQSSAWHE